MIFNEFWTLLQDELSHEQEFATLKQGKNSKHVLKSTQMKKK